MQAFMWLIFQRTLSQKQGIQPDNIKSEMLKCLKSTSAWEKFSTSNWFTIHLQRYKDHLQSCTKIRKLIDDKGLPAPPRGSSEELQRSNYLQIQKCFTLALLVLLVANIISANTIIKMPFTQTKVLRITVQKTVLWSQNKTFKSDDFKRKKYGNFIFF